MTTTTCTATRPTTGPTAGPTAELTAALDPSGPYGPCPRFAPGTADVPGAARPLAPSLERLLGFVAVTEELASLRAQLASRAAHCGPEATAGATRLLLAAFAADADGTAPQYRKAAALIRPLSLSAPDPAPRSGLTVDLTHRLLAREFGAANVIRFEDVDLPPALTHEPTRRFLRETGLPQTAPLPDPDDTAPLPTIAEAPAPHGLPSHAHRLIRLGGLTEDTEAVVDGATGEVWIWTVPEATLHPLARDLSTFTYALWLLHDDHQTPDAHDRLALLLLQALTATTPPAAPDTDWTFWTRLLADTP
ncbi:SUKH-4 family immunity protein [Streptomyces seoulensis]|nr:SUKH-4 family immunity protein [Streptomyces seoulensis]